VVPSQPAHRFFSTCTPDGHLTEYYTRCCGSFSTGTPDGHLHRILYQMLWFLLNLHTVSFQPAHRTATYTEYYTYALVPSQPAHRTATYTEYYTRCCGSFSTYTPDGHLTEYYTRCCGSFSIYTPFLFNLHTGRPLTQNTIHILWFLLNLHTVPFQPAHRTVPYAEYYTRCCINTI